MQLKSASSTIQVARYESSQDSGSAVRKAISLLGTKRADEFKDNPADFVMLCKRGMASFFLIGCAIGWCPSAVS